MAAAAAASAVAAQVARGRGRAALARGAFVSAAAPGYVTPGSKMIVVYIVVFVLQEMCFVSYMGGMVVNFGGFWSFLQAILSAYENIRLLDI